MSNKKEPSKQKIYKFIYTDGTVSYFRLSPPAVRIAIHLEGDHLVEYKEVEKEGD